VLGSGWSDADEDDADGDEMMRELDALCAQASG
jgi:hypothetical protein